MKDIRLNICDYYWLFGEDFIKNAVISFKEDKLLFSLNLN